MSRKKVLLTIAGVVALVVLWFSVYFIRSYQLNSYVKNMTTVAEKEEKNEEKKVKALKVIIDKKPYTVEEFMKLKEFPTTAEVIIAYEDSTMETKNCYISYNDKVDDFTYKDGVYGRILLPSKLNKEKE